MVVMRLHLMAFIYLKYSLSSCIKGVVTRLPEASTYISHAMNAIALSAIAIVEYIYDFARN